jgi:hypothetical protein
MTMMMLMLLLLLIMIMMIKINKKYGDDASDECDDENNDHFSN